MNKQTLSFPQEASIADPQTAIHRVMIVDDDVDMADSMAILI
jgi:CheY-like chemotaxis protein